MMAQRTISNPPAMQKRETTASARSKTAQQVWRTAAVVSEELTSCLFAVEESLSTSNEQGDQESETQTDELGGIETLEQFYSWYSTLETQARESGYDENEMSLEKLMTVKRQCDQLMDLIGSALESLDELQRLHDAVEVKTSVLHRETEALLQEKRRLAQTADLLHTQLAHYKTLDVATATLHHTNVSVADPAFFETLAKLDAALKFVRAHPMYRDADRHLLRFGQLQTRGLALLKDHVIGELRKAADQIMRRYQQNDGSQIAESFSYIEFRAIAPNLKPFCLELERRSLDARTSDMFVQCTNEYLSIRRQLCVPAVRENLMTLGSIPELSRAASEGASYLASLAHLEQQLYHCFFDRENAGLAKLLNSLAELWTDELNPHIIQCKSVAQLCGLLAALKAKSLASGGRVGWLKKTMDVAQERLIFLMQVSMREDLRDEADDAENAAAASNDSLEYPQRLAGESSDRWGRAQRCVLTLRRLKSGLADQSLFDGLAQETLLNTIHALVHAASLIQSSPSSSLIDAQLFLLKHVFILRDETKELNVSRGIQERSLDMNKLAGFLKSPSLKSLLPEMQTQSFDARKDLEILSVHTLEAFVAASVGPALQPVNGLLARSSALMASHGPEFSIHEQIGFGPEKIETALQECQNELNVRLPETLAVIKLYLPLSHRKAVFLAVQMSCLEPLAKLRGLLGDGHSSEILAALRVFVENCCASML